MTPFTKYWITATCAPESIVIIRQSDISALIGIKDEEGLQQVKLLEDLRSDTIVGLGYTYEDITIPVSYSFKEAALLVAEKLNLLSIPITDN